MKSWGYRPISRLPHQPRLGCSSFAGDITTGSECGIGAGVGGTTGASPEPITNGTGSRTVERRRDAAGSGAGGATGGIGIGAIGSP